MLTALSRINLSAVDTAIRAEIHGDLEERVANLEARMAEDGGRDDATIGGLIIWKRLWSAIFNPSTRTSPSKTWTLSWSDTYANAISQESSGSNGPNGCGSRMGGKRSKTSSTIKNGPRTWRPVSHESGVTSRNPMAYGHGHGPMNPRTGRVGARVVDSLPTSKLWASDPLCDTAHILPTGGVSAGLNGTVGNQPEMRPEASRQAPDDPPFKLPGQDSSCRKCNTDKAEWTDQESFAHAVPTSHVEDPDLALIVGVWDRLADECKQRLIEMMRANMPRQCDADEFDEINERRN